MATRDIEPGEEFLLDYGEAYTKAFLLPKPPCVISNISAGVMEGELPGGLVEEDEREGREGGEGREGREGGEGREGREDSGLVLEGMKAEEGGEGGEIERVIEAVEKTAI